MTLVMVIQCQLKLCPLFQVQLRHKFARLLGYDNYAEFAVGSRMAKTSAKVCNNISIELLLIGGIFCKSKLVL